MSSKKRTQIKEQFQEDSTSAKTVKKIDQVKQNSRRKVEDNVFEPVEGKAGKGEPRKVRDLGQILQRLEEQHSTAEETAVDHGETQRSGEHDDATAQEKESDNE